MNKLLQIVLVIMVIGHFLFADEWFFYPGKSEYKFDNIKIVQIIETKVLTSHPDFILEFYVGEKLQARYRNINVQSIFRSPNKNYFVGLSNSGIPGTAYVVFDKKGKLLREVKHECFDFVEYCNYSIVINREWINIKKPVLKFFEGSLGTIIQVSGCNGKKYNLLNKGIWGENSFYYFKKDSLDNKYNNIKIE